MKLLLLIITFSIAFTLSVETLEYDREMNKKLSDMGVYVGDPLENKIIGSEDMYVVIHNSTELSLTVMDHGARDYCKQTLGNNFTSKFMKILGRYTAYFSCEIQNKIDQYNLPDQEKECIEDRDLQLRDCSELNKKNADVINEIELQLIKEKKYKTNNYIYSVRAKFYDQIEELEQVAENKRN